MSSSSVASRWAAALATVRLGVRLYRRENPARPVIISGWFRIACTVLLFTLLGELADGRAGGDAWFVGAVLLAGADVVVPLVSDVPMRDRIDGTYRHVRAARLPPFASFALRSLPVMADGLGAMTVAALAVGAMTGRLPLAAAMLPAMPLVLASLASSAALGLVVIAPAIGTRLDTLTYNAATTVLALGTGALVPLGGLPVLEAISGVLPLTHAIAGVREALGGGAWAGSLVEEVMVGLGWFAVAALAYAAADRRGLRAGRGAFE